MLVVMARRFDAPVRAILGPTNTGKTYLAIERMCGHSSGVIGFPLRLLAREVYDRVCAMKGEKQVALLTGEERIVPPTARYFLCTAESMPVPGGDSHHDGDLHRDFAFAAIDEAQLGIDPERGHVFTDRMLRARGREETLILGSDTLRPVIRELLPDAEIVSRPRFSTLRYAGSVKLSRLPPPAGRQLRHARPHRGERRLHRGRDHGDRGAPLPPARLALLAQRRARLRRCRRADPQPRDQKRRSDPPSRTPGDRSGCAEA